MEKRRVAPCILLLLLGCTVGLPPLTVEEGEDSIVLGIQTLGEYPSAVSRVLIEEVESGKVVLELRAGETVPQIWKITLKKGRNPTIPFESLNGRYEILTPLDGEDFLLELGKEYRTTLWGADGRSSRSTTFSFSPTSN